MGIGFRFMLVTTDSEPVDPGVFLCAEPRWSVGDTFTLGRDRHYRILDVQPPTAADDRTLAHVTVLASSRGLRA